MKKTIKLVLMVGISCVSIFFAANVFCSADVSEPKHCDDFLNCVYILYGDNKSFSNIKDPVEAEKCLDFLGQKMKESDSLYELKGKFNDCDLKDIFTIWIDDGFAHKAAMSAAIRVDDYEEMLNILKMHVESGHNILIP